MFVNSGQSCNAPSRMIVPLSKMKEVAAIAKGVADKTRAGDPRAEGTTIGPVVNRGQWDKIQGLIQKGIEEGATLVAGGPGLPEGVNKGFYVRPTIFADVTENMTIAREEIFGPVLTILGAKDEAADVAGRVAEAAKVGVADDKSSIGPVASKAQFDKIQGLIQKGIDEGATVAAGGLGRPDGLDTGYYVKPTVFADVTNDMTIAREEIFGPVLCILGYDDIDQAVEIANDTEYGLAGYVSATDLDAARAVARRIRAGQVAINHAFDLNAAFGGYKRSGNGREWSQFGFEEYLEVKSTIGYAPGSSG